jgi:2-C-methyl-D-erythritol 4-phosphate cytidylyltransferase
MNGQRGKGTKGLRDADSRPRSLNPSIPRSPGVCYGLVLAGGRGQRYGGYKQFAQLAGRPILIHSVRAFERCRQVMGLVVVAPPRRLAVVRHMLSIHGVRRLIDVVPGGETRADSVRAGLAALPAQGFVAVHDAARPLILAGMLVKGFRLCRKRGAATYGYPVTDTLKRINGRDLLATVDRRNLLAVQTPQFFSLDLLRRAHAAARRYRLRVTDDCELIERLGVHPLWIPGPRTNIKLTTPDDLIVMQALT